MKDSGIVVADFKFPDELCDGAIELFEETLNTKPAGSQNNPAGGVYDSSSIYMAADRQDQVLELHKLSPPTIAKEINNYLTDALNAYMKKYAVLTTPYTGLFSLRQKMQKTAIAGGFHSWHCENYDMGLSETVLAWSIYLNDVHEGGETEFLYQSERIKPEKGKIVLFPAGFMHSHRGNPPISNEKYIVTGWFHLRFANVDNPVEPRKSLQF
jgi:hypothetical protein|tara:strand:- start:76 stop:711 length:636 start_codon:yes stop_codon:yes gene_type:complete